MIREVDEAILESLRKGLSDLIPPDNITIGELNPEIAKSISLVNKDFTIEEEGIGGSCGVKKEMIVEKFDSNGEKKDFTLSQKPLRPLIKVESPIGTEKKEIDDYSVDYNKGIVSFRVSPEKGGKVQMGYYIARAVAETRNLKFSLTYLVNILADDLQERNRITLEAIKVLYREKSALGKRGISDMRLIKGYSEKLSEDEINKNVIEFKVETSIQIEMPLPPIERIEIRKMEK
ncbi:MAG: hypothetical protein J5U19_12785 [Candidatus Methanoperedens sp.]|nr:hypothetical protein [Candidatus Methanoperedens sp.]